MKNYFKCNICSSKKIKILHTIYGYPMCGGPAVDSKTEKKIKKDKIIIGFCSNCGSCTLIYPSPEKLAFELYDDSYTSSNMSVALGAAIDSKRNNFVKLVTDLKLRQKSRLLEIGCYDGSLLLDFKKLGFSVFGCEPSPVAKIGIERYHLSIENEYFSPELYKPNFFDVVTLRNVLEHVFDPVSFLCSVRKVIISGGFIGFEVPDGFHRVAKAVLGSIVPEHPNYFWSSTLRRILTSAGFSNIQIKIYRGGLLVVAQKNSIFKEKLPLRLKLPSPGILKKIEVSYRAGVKKNLERHRNIFTFLKNNLTENTKVIIFGANTHSLELLVQGSLHKKWVSCIIDDDPLKWGKNLVGFGIPIKSRSFLKTCKNDYVLVICSYFSQDIIIDSLKKELARPLRILKTYPAIKMVSF